MFNRIFYGDDILRIEEDTKVRFTPSKVEVYTPLPNSTVCTTSSAKYCQHESLREKVWNFIDRLVEVYSLSAFSLVCGRCGNCCKTEKVLVRGGDLFPIANKLGISVSEFVEKYLEKAHTWNEYDGYIKLVDGKCPFLEEEKGVYSCSIYQVRPLQCRLFPPISPLCQKDVSYLITYLKEVVVHEGSITITLRGEDSPSYTSLLIDENLNNLLKEVLKELETIDEEEINEIDQAIDKAISMILHFIERIPTERKSENFEKEVKDVKDIVKDLSYMASIGWGEHPKMEELWQVYHKFLHILETPSQVSLSSSYDSSHYYISLFPDAAFVYPKGSSPVSLCYMHYPEIEQCVRNIVKEIVTSPLEDVQKVLSEENPLCYLCGECCRVYAVEITPRDIFRISKHMEMSPEEVYDKYLLPPRFSWNRKNGILKKVDVDGEKGCVFLEKRGDFFYCSIHTFKPDVCRKYSPTHKLCRSTINSKHWYRLPSNIFRMDVKDDSIIIYTEYTSQRNMEEGFSINWKENSSLEKEVHSLMRAIKKIVPLCGGEKPF